MRRLLEWLVLPGALAIALVLFGSLVEVYAARPLHVRLPIMVLASDFLVWLPLGAVAGFVVSKIAKTHRLAKCLLFVALCHIALVTPVLVSRPFLEAPPIDPTVVGRVFGLYIAQVIMILVGSCAARATSVA